MHRLEAAHPIRLVTSKQGRRLTWLAREMGISANYLHRILLGAEHTQGRPAPEWFYPRAAQLLGVPESMLRPQEAAEALAA